MALYIDSAYLADIQAVTRTVPLSGVTTNPTLLLAAQEQGQQIQAQEILANLVANVPGLVFIQPTVTDEERGYREALEAIQINPERVLPKIPVTETGMRIAQRLHAEGQRIAFTAVTTVAQAYVAAMEGAEFIIPYYNRLRRSGIDPHERIKQMAVLLGAQNLPTRIMAASIKSPAEATEALLAGAHDLTMPPQVLLDMVRDPETQGAVERFESDRSKLL